MNLIDYFNNNYINSVFSPDFINSNNDFIKNNNEKIINEGFFIFPTHITENIIIQKFLELDINSFFEEMNINKTNNIQKIYYKNIKFLLKLKK